MEDSRRRFNEDSVSERRDDRVERMSERDDVDEGGGKRTVDSEGPACGGLLPFILFVSSILQRYSYLLRHLRGRKRQELNPNLPSVLFYVIFIFNLFE